MSRNRAGHGAIWNPPKVKRKHCTRLRKRASRTGLAQGKALGIRSFCQLFKMFKTVCPPIKVIKGVQGGLLATLLGRTLIKRPEADSGPQSWALTRAVIGWFLWIPTARVKVDTEPCRPHCQQRKGQTSATALSHLLHPGDSLSEAPEQKGSWKKDVCVCVRQRERESVCTHLCSQTSPGPSWGSDTLLGTGHAELRKKPLSHPPGSRGWMRWKD